ncbi:cation:proton antiporter [Lacipirellula parvula]|uniref:Na/H antiporter n=1 Tax=Lacipirellula parvula TaxID=2650471 RepID=A0A5K7X226_9BACT|nr:cation:proton antiporter [Lacipirellula parvula]BBO30708.1 na/H antiporter [Lacipirellula parvula]
MNSNATAFDSSPSHGSTWKLVLGYALMIGGTFGLFLIVRHFGEAMAPPETAAVTGKAVGAKPHAIMHVLIALAAIIVAGNALGWLFRYFGQPQVIGEMVAGIMLGPSLLGRISPEAMQFVLPAEVGPYLGIIAQLGVILYMFLVGLELNSGLLRSHAHSTVAISHASIVAPFCLGSILALFLFRSLAPANVPFTSFALFMGIAMSITAFPVLARILTDRKMDKTDLGVVALSCAATDDVTAWCLLAFVVGIAQSAVGGAVQTVAMALGYIAVMFIVVRPLATRFFGQATGQAPKQGMTVCVLIALLLSALAAEWIGIHAIFGAFLLGAIIPHESDVARDLQHKMEDMVKILLLPAFFAFTGMRTEIGLVQGWNDWLVCGGIILIATLGKFGGTLAAAKMTGLNWRMASALGILMNTRGLMELVVLNIGLEMGVISPTLFAMMVIMALVTTIATTPILHLITGGNYDLKPQPAAA